MVKFFILLICHVVISTSLFANENLEDLASDIVLDHFVIQIPDYPKIYGNPSMVRWDGRILMSFRYLNNPDTEWHSKIGLVWLNDDFQIISPAELLDTRVHNPHIPSRSEDARLAVIGDRLFITYNDSFGGWDDGVRRVCLAELKHDGSRFYTASIDILENYPGEHRHWEKNWMPFDYYGTLLLVYSISPNRIYLPYIGLGSCDLVSETHAALSWDYGELRGGTPAILVDGEYLSFFHSYRMMSSQQSNGHHTFHYFFGAYTFSPKVPFGITRVSQTPIAGRGLYSYRGGKKVVYPGGFVYDENYIWLVCGRDDCEICMVKIDKKGLMNSLKPVYSHE